MIYACLKWYALTIGAWKRRHRVASITSLSEILKEVWSAPPLYRPASALYQQWKEGQAE